MRLTTKKSRLRKEEITNDISLDPIPDLFSSTYIDINIDDRYLTA